MILNRKILRLFMGRPKRICTVLPLYYLYLRNIRVYKQVPIEPMMAGIRF